MSNSDALAIFQQLWPTEGYAGIKQHLPDWSQSRASKIGDNGLLPNVWYTLDESGEFVTA